MAYLRKGTAFYPSTVTAGTLGSGVTGQHLCKAWVNWDGKDTVTIRDDFNVSSITDNAAGSYDVNFDTAMTNATYAVASACAYEVDAPRNLTASVQLQTVDEFRVYTVYTGNEVSSDAEMVSTVVFGD